MSTDVPLFTTPYLIRTAQLGVSFPPVKNTGRNADTHGYKFQGVLEIYSATFTPSLEQPPPPPHKTTRDSLEGL